MITNDKFCLSRFGKLKLNWSRYAVYLQRSAKVTSRYPLDEVIHQGGTYETTMAHSTPDEPTSGWTTTLGSGLPTVAQLD